MQALIPSIAGALLLGAANTLGDFVWAWLDLRHRTAFGIAHGSLLLLCLGLYLGVLVGRPLVGAIGGIVSGVLAAAVFYILAPILGITAMFAAWMALWIMVALLDGVLLRREAAGPALVRGVSAAVLSGLAFYAISDIWLKPPPDGPHYLTNFVSWTIAFLPGFLALLAGRKKGDSHLFSA
jgi:hypothetical protein